MVVDAMDLIFVFISATLCKQVYMFRPYIAVGLKSEDATCMEILTISRIHCKVVFIGKYRRSLNDVEAVSPVVINQLSM